MIEAEICVVLPHGPADTGELISHGDGGLVVTDALLEFERPAV